MLFVEVDRAVEVRELAAHSRQEMPDQERHVGVLLVDAVGRRLGCDGSAHGLLLFTRTVMPQGSAMSLSIPPWETSWRTSWPSAAACAASASTSAALGRTSSHSSSRASSVVAAGAPCAHVFVPTWW